MPTEKYNPNSPQIVGNEFVGIRDENLTFDPFANTFERGFEFQFSISQSVDAVRAYLNTFPEKFFRYGCLTAGIYPQGTEDQSGPVRSVIIPCNNGIVTGDAGGGGFSAIAFGGGATTAATALWNPSGVQYMEVRVGELYRSAASLFFAVNQYAQLLDGKRILGVDFLTTVDMGTTLGNGGNDQGTIFLFLDNNAGIILNNGASSTGSVLYSRLVSPSTPPSALEFVRVHLGDVNRYYGITTGSPVGNVNARQWTYSELQRFELSHAARLAMRITTPPVGVDSGSTNVLFSYAALEVFYCEERRVGFGTSVFQDTDGSSSAVLKLGATNIQVRSPRGDRVVVSPGNYSVTLSQSNLGDAETSSETPMVDAKFNALLTKREDYAPQVIPGVQVNLPYPLNQEAIGQTITAERTMILPQLSLHASGSGSPIPSPVNGTLEQSHVYGRQSVGQVYSASSPAYVMQSLVPFPIDYGRTYDWLRVWVRRFGDTTGSLRVRVFESPTTWTDSITVEEFDALDEIIDGWKEVNFDFTADPVILDAAMTVTFTSQPTLAAGNRWEVLGCAAPAVSGIPGNQLNLVPAPNTLTLSTYGEAVSGTVAETWLPQLGPYVSGATLDLTADLSFMFSQTQPMITGFGVTEESQPVSGIGEDCGGIPCCIPSAILYNQLTWGLPINTSYLLDEFARTEVNGWGTATTGQAWSAPVGGAASQASVSDGVAQFSPDAGSAFRYMIQSDTGSDFDVTATMSLDSAYIGQTSFGLVGRYGDANNNYEARVSVLSTGVAAFGINKIFSNTFTILTFLTLPFSVADQGYGQLKIRFMGYGPYLKAKVWNINEAEPEHWTTEVEDSSLTTEVAAGLSLPGTTGNYASTPDNAALDIVGDIELLVDVSMDSSIWNAGSPTFLSKWNGAQRSYRVGLNGSGAIVMNWSTTGADTVTATSTAAVPSSSGRLAVRATLDVNNGGGGSTATFYTGPTISGPWTQLGAPVVGAVTSIFASTAEGAVGARNGGVDGLFAGIVHAAKILNGLAGTEVANPDFGAQAPGTTVFADAAGRTWTVNGTAAIVAAASTTGVGTVFLDQIGSGSTFSVDDFEVTPPATYFGYYELQRMDEVETDWQTIMKASDPAHLFFNDYEARIGVETSYRIRNMDLYEFPGPWSETITTTLTDPGIEGGDCVLDGHILVFTSNEHQDGSINLAYASVWMGDNVQEDFAFPEANFVQLQAMYDRDFFTAFRPTERGGEAFTRTMLVQAAAIAPETLADFRSLRDMAWSSVNYICVRDEDGNRWFATVIVPEGRVLRGRRLYLAPVAVTEVTDTPTPVDPAA